MWAQHQTLFFLSPVGIWPWLGDVHSCVLGSKSNPLKYGLRVGPKLGSYAALIVCCYLPLLKRFTSVVTVLRKYFNAVKDVSSSSTFTLYHFLNGASLEVTRRDFENAGVMKQGTNPFGMKIDSIPTLNVFQVKS
ncbi:hypothetical protein V6N11_022395 [Hibiscus sabdariffa]|uniref:Uncharacterized protein n=1 Tax=Hibiscus sabdariffa TaxID=183260 RepID=A0ABR2TJ71_9ROSI